MSRVLLAAFLTWPVILSAQGAIPVFLGQSTTMLAPTVDGSGRTVVFGSAIAAGGANLGIIDLYVASPDGSGLRRLTQLPGLSFPQPKGATAVSFSANAARAAFIVVGPTTSLPTPVTGPVEEVHVVEVSSGADHIVAVDTQGCVQPLETPICLGCSFTCVNTPHISADGAKVLYAVSRSQPFYVVNADGTGLKNLPVFIGSLAPAAQRVISRNGLVAFTSSAPSGPTLAASATDVYVMNLDGTNIRNVTKFGNNTSLFPSNATISADGGAIVFESTGTVVGTGSQATQIWLVHTDGSGLRPLTTGSDSSAQPSISGDGSLVAFVKSGQVSIVHSDGTGLKVLTNFNMSAARDPVISEDGSLVVFDIGPRDGGIGAIYAVNSDGSNLRAVYAPRVLNQNGVVGIVSGFRPSPGSLFSAYGMNLAADSITAANSFPLPPTLAGVSLLVNGIPAPLLAATPWQVNAQLPSDLLEGPVSFQFRFADGTLPPAAAADIKSIAPAIFILPPTPCPLAPPQPQPGPIVVCTIWSQAAAFHANSATPADQAHPAAVGESLEIYGTGLGLTDPFVPAGLAAPGSPPARTLTIPQVLIGTIPAKVTFAGLTPGFAGVYQVNVVVPPGVKSNSQSVVWRVGTTESNFGTIFIQ